MENRSNGQISLRCERVATRSGMITNAELIISDGAIVAVAPIDGRHQDQELVTGWVLPGFVDTHGHGGGGHDYATTDPAEALQGRDFHRRHGTTTAFASLVTAPIETLCAQLATLGPLVVSGEFAGIHLEGPFLSAAKCGAHDPALLLAPEPRLVDQLLRAGDGRISMITIAPELAGGLAAIERITAAGVVAAIGHTDGDELVARQAVAAGATVVTHLFNAMRPVHHRDPGPIPLLLSDDRIMVELIADGFHLHPDVIMMALAAAGPERIALITDAMVAAGMPDGRFELGRLRVQVRNGQARLINPDGQLGSIAGSTLTMAAAVELMVGLGVPIPAVAQMAASTPARNHGLPHVGEIAVGCAADLCVVDDHGALQRVMQSGVWMER